MSGGPLLALQAARGHLFPMVPIMMACGIGLWFGPSQEYVAWAYFLALAGIFGGLSLRGAWHPVGVAIACVAFGFLISGARAHMQKAPVLNFRYYGPIEGRVVEIDRSQSDKLRITLDRVVLSRVDPERTPERVRVSLHDDLATVNPGTTVMLTGHLDAPQAPAEPGGFDFRRMAFFDRLGAVGYSRTPVMLLAYPEAGTRWIDRIRAHLSAAVQKGIPGQAGAFASGSVTGDRSGITGKTTDALRDSNLSHLLAISGMNLAFLVGFTFAILRYGLAVVPLVALHLNTKKIAAVAALGVASFYLALSGGNVATERAYIMAVIMLGAILCDRRALSMRTVALSAIVLLTLQPEALFHPGFQMSMAATVMLVWGFGLIDRQTFLGRFPRWMLPVYTAVLSSVLGGLATGPIAAAHFNRFTDYGLLANLLTVPAMGTLIMPGAVVASILAFVGFPQPGLWMMELGARWILAVAKWIAGWEGSVTGIHAPGSWVLPLITLGFLWAIIWPGRARWAGVVAMCASLGLWFAAERPSALISADAAVVAVMGPEGRAFSHPRGAGFAAGVWLEDDGDLATQSAAFERTGIDGDAGLRTFRLGDVRVAYVKGRGAGERVGIACESADLVIASVEAIAPEGCLLFDKTVLETTGAIALHIDGRGVRVVQAQHGNRLWMEPSGPRTIPDVILP